jgi:hypothetical protein
VEPIKPAKPIRSATVSFLLAVFGDELAGPRPVVVTFQGNPVSVPPKVWFGWPWQGTPDFAVTCPQCQQLFQSRSLRPDEAGDFRRQKGRFHALYAVMLDDIRHQGSRGAADVAAVVAAGDVAWQSSGRVSAR